MEETEQDFMRSYRIVQALDPGPHPERECSIPESHSHSTPGFLFNFWILGHTQQCSCIVLAQCSDVIPGGASGTICGARGQTGVGCQQCKQECCLSH